jgi:cold shock CspA family protein
MVHGVVTAFSDDEGSGLLIADDGTEYYFHCTQIAGGNRSIDVGVSAIFDLSPALLGRYEAVDVAPVSKRTLCPVCGASLDGDPRAYEICDTCGWEDDPIQFDDPSFGGGANEMNLNDARTTWVSRQRTS